jgi:hypothetical protein
MACKVASAGKVFIGITAAGFPANRRLVKASTWNIGVRIKNVTGKVFNTKLTTPVKDIVELRVEFPVRDYFPFARYSKKTQISFWQLSS